MSRSHVLTDLKLSTYTCVEVSPQRRGIPAAHMPRLLRACPARRASRLRSALARRSGRPARHRPLPSTTVIAQYDLSTAQGV